MSIYHGPGVQDPGRDPLLAAAADIVAHLPRLPIQGETTWPVAVRRLEALRLALGEIRGTVPDCDHDWPTRGGRCVSCHGVLR